MHHQKSLYLLVTLTLSSGLFAATEPKASNSTNTEIAFDFGPGPRRYQEDQTKDESVEGVNKNDPKQAGTPKLTKSKHVNDEGLTAFDFGPGPRR